MSYSNAFSQAIVTCAFIADKVQQGLYEYVPTSAISKSLNLKAPTLVKILSALAKAQIIETREGKTGGVRLKKSADKITLLHIFDAMESHRPLFQCHLELGSKGDKPDKAKKMLVNVLTSAEKAMKKDLSEQSLQMFVDKLY